MKHLSELSTAPKGAILFRGKYGATRQYARWISDSTGLPVFDLAKTQPELEDYDFLVLGSAVYVGQVALRRWMRRHWDILQNKRVLFFTVSGSPADHPDLKAALDSSLTPAMLEYFTYIPLRGRLDLRRLPWWLRMGLRWVAKHIEDPEARERLSKGFNYVDRAHIDPILDWIEEVMAEVEMGATY